MDFVLSTKLIDIFWYSALTDLLIDQLLSMTPIEYMQRLHVTLVERRHRVSHFLGSLDSSLSLWIAQVATYLIALSVSATKVQHINTPS